MLVNLSIKEFLAKTAENTPVPGGGSVAALNAAIAASLAEMVANLTIGKKKYEDKEELMQSLASITCDYQQQFVRDIDADSDAYNQVFKAFKLPKDTEAEKAVRAKEIQDATKCAAQIPMEVARKAYALMDFIVRVADEGNQNAITDACVAMMNARTAVLSALLNVRINLMSIKDEAFVKLLSDEANRMEREAITKEQELIQKVNKIITS